MLELSLTPWLKEGVVAQSCPTLCDPRDSSPPGSPVPGILQARTLERVAISFSNAWKWKVKVKSLSRVWLFVTPWTVAHQAPPSMGFSRQGYWRGVPFPSPGDLSDPGIKPRSPALQADALTSEPPGTSTPWMAWFKSSSPFHPALWQPGSAQTERRMAALVMNWKAQQSPAHSCGRDGNRLHGQTGTSESRRAITSQETKSNLHTHLAT